jgi:hypothetical protein
MALLALILTTALLTVCCLIGHNQLLTSALAHTLKFHDLALGCTFLVTQLLVLAGAVMVLKFMTVPDT